MAGRAVAMDPLFQAGAVEEDNRPLGRLGAEGGLGRQAVVDLCVAHHHVARAIACGGEASPHTRGEPRGGGAGLS